MKRVATIILNRNLPEVTNSLYDHLQHYDGALTDIYIVEAGSDDERLARHYTWHANSAEARKHGLRYCRGMNYGLFQLWQDGKFSQYDAFFLLTNDTEFEHKASIAPLMSILDTHPHLGILSPCAARWGERLLMHEHATKYFWFIHNNAYLLRRQFIESIFNPEDERHFLFDGDNFRGYGAESELIAKAYANDWAAAITTEVIAGENESHLLNKVDLIKTEGYEENLRLYVEEGRAWMRKKYGFNSRWSMQQYVKSFYDHFFDFHPEYEAYKI
ncbi:hypothetical protein V8J88_08990 [Massilia sp. W12]|uniref:hypothetical protein n=1 Tax=Massilia sp. W12 TaxID=3126507 RepID=UPI0030D205EF